MNLVVDDTVEVTLPTKTEEEKRRQLGVYMFFLLAFSASPTVEVLC